MKYKIEVVANVRKDSDGAPLWTWYVLLGGRLIKEGGAYDFTPAGKAAAKESMLRWLGVIK